MAHGSPHSRAGSSLSLGSLVDRVVEVWLDDFDLSEQSIRRMIEVSERFVRFVEDVGGSLAADVSTGQSEAFIKALVPGESGGRTPALATMHLRRASLRLLFRTARDLGFFEGDPTMDLVLPPRTSLKTRPLSDEEVALCRSFSLRSLTETRLPAAWALAEATARTSEIPHVRVSDVDVERGRVWLHGSPKTEPRWGQLTTWGLSQVIRRIESLAGKHTLLVYSGQGNAEAKQAASCRFVNYTRHHCDGLIRPHPSRFVVSSGRSPKRRPLRSP